MKPSGFELRRLAAIYLGGVLGALARVGLAQATPHGPGGWPWGTFVVNMLGALALGYFFARLGDHPEESLAHPFLTTGICGTLTTFSTLQLELFEMVDAGHLGLALTYLGATLLAGFTCVRAGIAFERRPEAIG
jgi:fluoride exporter